MNTVVPFSYIRQTAIKSTNDSKKLRKIRSTITPQNIVDLFSIHKVCFYANITFGIFYNDFLKIKNFVSEKYDIFFENEFPEFPETYTIKEFSNGGDIIRHFKKINMNRTEYDRRVERIQRQNSSVRNHEIDYSLLNFSHIKNHRIICIDTEVQTDSLNITELGLVFSNQGTIEARHFLIKEYKDLKKERKNMQDYFNFGKSEIVTIKQMKKILIKYLNQADIFMAHSIHSENHYLKQIDINLLEHIEDYIDTQSINKYLSKEDDPISLENLLKKLDIPYSFLHNSGNDAFYTWQSFINMLTIKNNFKNYHNFINYKIA